MQLESFLATIGPSNIACLRSINISAPLWHLGVREDYIEGAILDLTSPVSRMAVIKPPARDRLLAAIQSSVDALIHAGSSFDTLTLHLFLTHAGAFSGRHDGTTLLAMSDAEEVVRRKQKGVELLRRFSESLPRKPVLRLLGTGRAGSKGMVRKANQTVMDEAGKYGWSSM